MKIKILILGLMGLGLILAELSFSDTQRQRTLSRKDRDNFKVIMSTKFDFSETQNDGEMKAPDGFFLQGRQQQSLSEMVRLRSNFKRQLRNSGSAVNSLSK